MSQKRTGRAATSDAVRREPGGQAPGGADLVDTESRDSFPASDPPARTPVTRTGDPLQPERRES